MYHMWWDERDYYYDESYLHKSSVMSHFKRHEMRVSTYITVCWVIPKECKIFMVLIRSGLALLLCWYFYVLFCSLCVRCVCACFVEFSDLMSNVCIFFEYMHCTYNSKQLLLKITTGYYRPDDFVLSLNE